MFAVVLFMSEAGVMFTFLHYILLCALQSTSSTSQPRLTAQALQELMVIHTHAGLFGYERGDILLRAHAQGVVRYELLFRGSLRSLTPSLSSRHVCSHGIQVYTDTALIYKYTNSIHLT